MTTLDIDLTIKGSDEVEKQVASELELPDPTGTSMAKIVESENDKETPKTNPKPD